MLSEFEYSYLLPGVNCSGSPCTEVSSCSGGGATAGEALTASWKAGGRLKSGTPLVCCSSSARVTSAQAAGWLGNTLPIVSSSLSLPSATAETAAAPLKALATLAMRTTSSIAIGCLVVGVGDTGGEEGGADSALNDDRHAGRSVGALHEGVERSLPARRRASTSPRHCQGRPR